MKTSVFILKNREFKQDFKNCAGYKLKLRKQESPTGIRRVGMSGSCESEGEEQCSYNRCVSVCGCMWVYGGSSVRNCVVMSHVFVWSEQDGCECDGFV